MTQSAVINEVRHGFYLDSVALMRLSAELAALPEVADAVLMIGTDANKQIMREAGLLSEAGRKAGPNDLVIALRAGSDQSAAAALSTARERLDARSTAPGTHGPAQPRSLDLALERLPDANLALISTPGEFAAREANRALDRGLNVMIFSDHVPLENEVSLKKKAQRCELLVMGPDCGTAIIDGAALGFANAVPRGRIGIVSASGTGLQEVSVLLARAGEGVSHGIGVGGRDLSDAVGGLSTLNALAMLAEDPRTEAIILISKPPGPKTAERVFARLAELAKPVTVCMFGFEPSAELPSARVAPTLKGAVEACLGHRFEERASVWDEDQRTVAGRRWIHGLYSGGTLCAEAQAMFRAAGVRNWSNVPLSGDASQDDGAGGHCLVDLGADEYTLGRPHPMLEPGVRSPMLSASLGDRNVAVVLLDVMLGFGVHPDPAGAVAETMAEAPDERPVVVASVCGTEADPQRYSTQTGKLKESGVLVAACNADAVSLALNIVHGSQER